MPKEPVVMKARRRARRSLPSAIERNLSLEELIKDDRQTRRQKQDAMAQAKLQLMNAVSN